MAAPKLDFETKVFVKEDATELFRAFLSRDGWRPESIVLAPTPTPISPASGSSA